MFQKQDARNFHAWNYCRFITALRNISDEEELQFTTDMINDNFSNYSAWHNRSVLLSHPLKERVQGYFPKENVLANEYEFVRNALFTDPDDQSGWFYHLWLLAQTVKQDTLLLDSSWPPHGSELHVTIDGSLDGCALPPITSFQSTSGTFPVVLYFKEAVRGANLTTVTIEAEYSNSDLSWRPLLANIFGCAQAWVAYLDYPNEELHASMTYPVKCQYQLVIHNNVKTKLKKGFHGVMRNSKCMKLIARIQAPLIFFYNLIINEDSKPTYSKWHAETIANEIAHYRELLSFSNCKIGKLTLARLLLAHDAMMSYNSTNSQSVVHSEVLELYLDLMKMDPTHSQYYKDEYSLVLLNQVTSSRESLLGYCRQYKESASTCVSDFICLRLIIFHYHALGLLSNCCGYECLTSATTIFSQLKVWRPCSFFLA